MCHYSARAAGWGLCAIAAIVLSGGALLGAPAGYAAAPSDAGQPQVSCAPAPAWALGPDRYWANVQPSYQYYYGPNYRYDAEWYRERHLSCPQLYQAYPYDPAAACNTEYYYMPDDGLYYCYAPDPVAENSALQGRCPGQPYLYICP
jgi:hypothetical protein